jgi:hypothetical protein
MTTTNSKPASRKAATAAKPVPTPTNTPVMTHVTVRQVFDAQGDRKAASELVAAMRGEASLYRHDAPAVITFEDSDVYLVLRSFDEMSFVGPDEELAYWRLPHAADASMTVNVLTEMFFRGINITSIGDISVALRGITAGDTDVGLNRTKNEGGRTAAEYAVYEVAGVTVRFNETKWYTRYNESRCGDDSYSGKSTKTAASARKLYRAVASGKLAHVQTVADLEAYCAASRIALESFHSVWR